MTTFDSPTSTDAAVDVPRWRYPGFSGWEAKQVLAVASEHFEGVRIPKSDQWAIKAARKEVERADAILADPDRFGTRDLDGYQAVLEAAERMTNRPSPFASRRTAVSA